MLPYILKVVRLSTIVTIVYMFLQSLFHSFWGVEYSATIFAFPDTLWVAFITIVLSYFAIDTATLSSILRLNIGSFTISLRKDITKPLILYDNEWDSQCLKIREAASSLGMPLLIYPIPSISPNLAYFHNYPVESRFSADAILLHPGLKLALPMLVDPNTSAIVHGEGIGETINNYIYVNYSKRLTDVDPPPPLTIGPLDDATSFLSTLLRKGSLYGYTARPSVYNKIPLHFYGNQADGASRVIREWLCRLQLSYILYPTSRGSIYRAVLQHQIHSVFTQQRSKLIFERFNILVLYENEKKRILEEMTEEDLITVDNNTMFDQIFNNIETTSLSSSNPNTSTTTSADHLSMNNPNPSDRRVNHRDGTTHGPSALPHRADSASSLQQPDHIHPDEQGQRRSQDHHQYQPIKSTPSKYHPVVLQDSTTSQLTLMKDQDTQLRVEPGTFLNQLERFGYRIDNPQQPHQQQLRPTVPHDTTDILNDVSTSRPSKQTPSTIPTVRFHGEAEVWSDDQSISRPPFNRPSSFSVNQPSKLSTNSNYTYSQQNPPTSTHTPPTPKPIPNRLTSPTQHQNRSQSLSTHSAQLRSVDERLLMTSNATFVRSVGLTMLYDPNTDISCFGETAIVQYLRTMYEIQLTKTNTAKTTSTKNG